MNNTHKYGPEIEAKPHSRSIKSIFLAIYSRWLLSACFVVSLVSMLPVPANAGLFSTISGLLFGGVSISAEGSTPDNFNSQNLPLLHNSANFGSSASTGGGDILVVDDGEALMSENGPSGTLADVSETTNNGQINKYIVRRGDTLSSVAKMFGVSQNTIIWANDKTTRVLKEGEVLVILPVSGTIHTVAKGDTLKSVAKKYKADIDEIAQFNNLDTSATLSVGDQIIIPDGEGAIISSGLATNSGLLRNPFKGGDGPDYPGYYIRPIVGGVKTQGLHGWNAVDLGTPVGTPVYAAASGEIIISRNSGWNGGYGRYIVVSHYNGTQTLYAHLSNNLVFAGERVAQGQIIATSGNSGNSTGPHLHFEVRGAKNPLQ